jgi:hypothetical protein
MQLFYHFIELGQISYGEACQEGKNWQGETLKTAQEHGAHLETVVP